jgi:hypothetical protein
MKTLILSFAVMLFISISSLNANPVNDSVSMGPGYANDVWYSFENGVVATADRSTWDIGFYTNTWSAGIIINDGTGTQLVTYGNGDTSSWNAIDTTGMANWKRLYNSDTIWEDGAFNRNALGHPDYGWGVYNMVSHDVVGDSIYIIKLANGAYKKLWIESKNSVNNTYIFTYANLDGSNQFTETLNATPYESKLFVYYNLSIGSVIDREPAKDSWDLLFSRYMGIVFDNEGNPANYVVVGILNNVETGANKNHPVSPDFTEWYAQPMEFYKTVIGSDWKYFDMNTFSYSVTDSLVYFVQSLSGDIYKFVPLSFSGQSEGKTVFTHELISLVDLTEQTTEQAVKVFPNPASDQINIQLTGFENELASIQLYDLSGRMLLEQETRLSNGQMNFSVQQFEEGTYILRVISSGKVHTQQLIVR